MQFMWADTLLAAERAHLIRLDLWGGASLLVGTALLGLMRMRGHRSALLDHFGIQIAAWGAVELALALPGLHRLELRDLAGATRLDRMLWLNIGLDVGYVMVGLTLLVLGWRMARRWGSSAPGLAVDRAGLGARTAGSRAGQPDLALSARDARPGASHVRSPTAHGIFRPPFFRDSCFRDLDVDPRLLRPNQSRLRLRGEAS